MVKVSLFARAFLPAAIFVLMLSACDSGGGSSGGGSGNGGGSGSTQQPSFTQTQPPVTFAQPGEVIQLGVSASQAEIDAGLLIGFTEANGTIFMPPFHLEGGKAFVMVPGFNASADTQVTLSLVTASGTTVAHMAGPLVVKPLSSSPKYDRLVFSQAVGGGLAKIVHLAVDCLNTLHAEGMFPQAQDVITGLEQQKTLLNDLHSYTFNLNDPALAIAMQLLENSKLLDLLAQTANVSLTGLGSGTSPQHSILAELIESALLKADFASLLLGEARGMLNLINWACTQASSWPLVGGAAQSVASWAAGLAAQLKTPHDIINQYIPCDLVQMTTTATSLTTSVGGSVTVQCKGRFETEEAFNQAAFTQTVTTYVNQAASWVMNKMQQNPAISRYSGYVQQVANLIPGWINNWMQSNGLLQTSVVPGSNFTVLTIEFDLDMAQYRLDTAGIVANLLNLPRGIVTAFFDWVGFGYGSPVGQYEGVKVPSIATYETATDSIKGVSAGSGTAEYVAPLCRPATGWWAQWGFYALNTTSKSLPLTVN